MDYKNKILDIILEHSIVEDIAMEDTLSSIGIDSLKTVELIIALEDSLDVIFDDSDIDPENLKTVGSVIAMTQKYMDGKGILCGNL